MEAAAGGRRWSKPATLCYSRPGTAGGVRSGSHRGGAARRRWPSAVLGSGEAVDVAGVWPRGGGTRRLLAC